MATVRSGSMAMDVDDAVLHRLLEVQREDTAITRLSERRRTLPEAARLAEVTDQLAELEADLAIARKQNEELAREHARLEGEIELLAAKTEREEGRLFSGGVSNPKELGALQAEVEMLKRKRGSLEDALLEVMVQRDQADETTTRLEVEHRSAAAEAEELSGKVSELTSAIDEELAQHTTIRAELVTAIPEALLSLYDGLRSSKAGVGAAALVGGTCEGCHTRLPSVEVERLKAAAGLQRCDNCRRILIV